MQEELINGEAERLSGHPVIRHIFDEMEQDAMERAIYARPSDDEARRSAMNEVRAIRALRQKLKILASGLESPAKKMPEVGSFVA